MASSLIPPSAIKKELPSRLPSFKPPRDLLLTGSTTSHTAPALKDFINAGKSNKRKYTPNVNIFRKNTQPNDSSETETKTKQTDHSKKTPAINKKRNSNFIQTKGVFSEGLAPGKVKAFHSSHSERSYNESNVLEKPKLVLNQKINKSNEDAKLQSILKDDFIDDPSNLPDLNFLPSSLPTVYNGIDDIEKTFQNLQVKVEKVGANQSDDVKDQKCEVLGAFEENENPKLLLFEFPKILQGLDEVEEKKRSKTQSASETESKV
ncbi:UNVERIFIED_CONTAM: hypothetical protein PYX00_003191 [Menopon gallinae]|uniref:Uncharacterized protein n=1 Tax=Menopon gallinae TaxID=328185 RepID=A0AAW2HZX7_9NEOP